MIRSLVVTLVIIASTPALAQAPAAPTLVLQPPRAEAPPYFDAPPVATPAFDRPKLHFYAPLIANAIPSPSFGRALGGSFIGLGLAALAGLAVWGGLSETCDATQPWSFCGATAILGGAVFAAQLAPFSMAAGASALGGHGGGAGYGLGLLGALLGAGLTTAAGFFASYTLADAAGALVFTGAVGLVTTSLLTAAGFMLGASLRDRPALEPMLSFSSDAGLVGVRGAF